MPVLAAEIPIRIVSAFGAALADTENTVVPIAASGHREPDDVTLHYSSSGPKPLAFCVSEGEIAKTGN